MDDDSPGDRGQGRSFWGGLRAFLLGDGSESSLRDEIEEVLENREGEAPRVGDLSAAEREMLKNILHFGEKTAGDVAVPRGEIIAVPADIGLPDLITALAEAEHSRLPVYDGNLDRVVGMIHLKDVFLHHFAPGPDTPDIRTLMRTPLFVPESMGMLDLLARMRAGRVHLAIVVDEFGGTEGLLTIEDVVEEIVGDIEDEHDEELPGLLAEVAPGVWEADARAELEDVAEAIDERLGLVEEDVDTLGGLTFILAGRIPQPGETVEHPTGWRFEVTEGDTRRVRRLRLHAPQEATAED
ncbi:hemolysin family protein [Sphingosinicella sp.]|uniref:hemolysin family protein n=1 Tax=Sphingosinicella sp. TaxID=1917971 RepID=UPI0040379058